MAKHMAKARRLSSKVTRRMRAVGLPVGFLLNVVNHILLLNPDLQRDLDGVEFFAGTKVWASALKEQGYNIATMEINDDQPQQDILSPEGFIYAVTLLLRSKFRAVHHYATVCSSWVTINRGTSGRCLSRPLGRAELPYVARANIMVARASLLMLLGVCTGVGFILEQPMTSLMGEHPRMVQLRRLAECGGIRAVSKITTWMGAFGGEVPKPTFLLGTVPWLHQLKRTITRGQFLASKSQDVWSKYMDAHGRRRFVGGQNLKQTQVYPRGYGQATAAIMQTAIIDVDSDDDFDFTILEKEGELYRTKTALLWADADLGAVWKMVNPNFK